MIRKMGVCCGCGSAVLDSLSEGTRVAPVLGCAAVNHDSLLATQCCPTGAKQREPGLVSLS